MAGEWIQVDCCLFQKPEVLKICAATGLDRQLVGGRVVALWCWSSLNCADGTAEVPVSILCELFGGDEAFWYEVEKVGWLQIDAENGTVGVPGWDGRFSKAAKSRALSAVRHQVDKAGGATRPSRGRNAPPRGAQRAPERRDRGDRSSSSSPQCAAQPEPDSGPHLAGWDTLREAWRAGTGRPWKLPDPPDKVADRLAEPGWFAKALAAIEALPRCRYFADPVTLPQLVAEGFVDKVLGGQFDNPRRAAVVSGRPDDRPPAQGWSGDDAARFEATKAALAAKIRQEGAA